MNGVGLTPRTEDQKVKSTLLSEYIGLARVVLASSCSKHLSLFYFQGRFKEYFRVVLTAINYSGLGVKT